MPTSGVSALSQQIPRAHKGVETVHLFRGLAIIIMVLDPTRKFLHHFATNRDPLDVESVKVMFFFTRWITHFSAPVFIFMTGVLAFLFLQKAGRKKLIHWLLPAGLLLILTDAILMSFITTFDPGFSLVLFSFLWALGISMIFTAILSYLPFYLFLVIALVILFGHNLIDHYEYSRIGQLSVLHNILHRPVYYPVNDQTIIGIVYPFLPWTGLMMTGYCFGNLFNEGMNIERRNRILRYTGIFLLLFFIVLRYSNVYGDPSCWSVQSRNAFTILSFISTTKHPPSLLFLSMTMGPALILISYSSHFPKRFANIFTVYGRVPVFFFIIANLAFHILAAVLALIRGHSLADGWKGEPGVLSKFVYPGEGVKIGVVYVLWLLIVIALYPLCKWAWKKKSSSHIGWIKYL